MVLAALRQAGMPKMSMSRQFSLWSGQRKVAGTAFALNSQRALLHGCILVHSDLQRLRAALHLPGTWSCQATGVPSVRAPVTAIVEHQPGLTTSEVAAMIAEQATGTRQDAQITAIVAADCEASDDFQQSREKFRGFAWTYGRVGDFAVQVSLPLGWLHLQVSGGLVSRAVLERPPGTTIISSLHGLPLTVSTEELLSFVMETI